MGAPLCSAMLQAPGLGTGREQQPVVADLTGRGLHRVRPGVEGGRVHAKSQVDVVLGVPLAGMDERVLEGVVAQQVPLRQGRPLVRRVVLRADEHHRPVVPLLPQLGGGGATGQPGSDDDDRHLTSWTFAYVVTLRRRAVGRHLTPCDLGAGFRATDPRKPCPNRTR